jgi:beta-glucuronidase
VDHGLVDENRQRRPSYEVWKDANSPARISAGWNYDSAGLPIGFHTTIERRGPDEIPSYILREYRVSWEVRDDNGEKLAASEKELPDMGPPQSLEASWKAPISRALTLHVTVLRPTGFVAAEKTLTWWEPRAGGLTVDEMKRRGTKVPD